MDNPNQVTYFGETDTRNRRVPFGIKAKDRTRHVYVIGKTGMGKSTLLENMAVQDIKNGNGLAFLDPHGKSADLLLEYVPKERMNDVIYLAPFDMEYPVSFNVMEDVGYDKRHLVVSGLMSTFKKIWQDAWSARMEYILGNTLFALLEYPDATLLDVNRMYSDKEFRKKVVDYISDPTVKSFWVDEYAKYTDKFAAEATPAIQNKIGQFTSNPLIRNIIGQPKSSFNLREIMDQRKILIINLSKGRIGDTNANLLGGMLITKIYLAAMSRADSPEEELQKLPNFYLFVDEFQNFANASFADILSEARKYKLNLTIAHQYIEQMSEEVQAAVFGNVGSMIVFRVGATDADPLEKEFAPVFMAQDLVNLGMFQIYLKLMIDGVGSQPFSATSMKPIPKPTQIFVKEIIDASRSKYASDRKEVEKFIIERMKQAPSQSSSPKERSKNFVEKKVEKNEKKEENKEKIHRPFKEALRKEFIESVKPVPEKRVVQSHPQNQEQKSLKDLEHKGNGNQSKGPTQQSSNDLKKALEAILSKNINIGTNQVSISTTNTTNTTTITKTETKPEPQKINLPPKNEKHTDPQQGLSEEELKNLLKVD